MQPTFLILADSTDITRAVADRLLELVVTDEAGLSSDALRLTLDDRRRADGAIAQLPKIGTVLEVSLSYTGRSWVAMGKFIVDEIEIRSPPATLSVSAKAADMVGPFRSPKTRSREATTLGALVSAIATEHRYQAKIDPELGAIAVPHLDQTAESDMALLTRLAAKHDAVAKPVAGFLVLARQGAAKTITGQSLPTLQLEPEQLAQWRYQHSARKPAGTGSAQGENGQSPPHDSNRRHTRLLVGLREGRTSGSDHRIAAFRGNSLRPCHRSGSEGRSGHPQEHRRTGTRRTVVQPAG